MDDRNRVLKRLTMTTRAPEDGNGLNSIRRRRCLSSTKSALRPSKMHQILLHQRKNLMHTKSALLNLASVPLKVLRMPTMIYGLESDRYAMYNLRFKCHTERAMWYLESEHGSGV
jgi:hypothetical protein